MDRFMIKHPSKFTASLARHIRPDTKHTTLGIPFTRGTLETWRPKGHGHPHAAQGLKQRLHRDLLLFKARWMAHHLLHLLQRQRRLA